MAAWINDALEEKIGLQNVFFKREGKIYIFIIRSESLNNWLHKHYTLNLKGTFSFYDK